MYSFEPFLHAHVAGDHLPVLLASVVGPEVLLDENGRGAHLQETTSKRNCIAIFFF